MLNLINDSQLLELLHDLNRSPQLEPSFRYDLSPPSVKNTQAPPSQPASDVPYRLQPISVLLRKCRENLSPEDRSIAEYRALQDTFLEDPAVRASKSLALLSQYDDTTAKSTSRAAIESKDVISGYPTLSEEERYQEALDGYLNGNAATPRVLPPGRAGDRISEREKEIALKNPVSVYNWLRDNHPGVFLQDNEPHAEKSSARPSNSRTSKRASTIKQEPELYDEDGIAIEARASAKGKRKRDEDGGYRPKGGNGRASKRKKEDGPPSVKKSKKRASVSGA